MSALTYEGLCSWFINLRPESLMNYPCHLQQIPLWLQLIQVRFCPLNSQGLYQDPFALQSQTVRERGEGGQKPGQLHLWARLTPSQVKVLLPLTPRQPAAKGAAFSWKHVVQEGICGAP